MRAMLGILVLLTGCSGVNTVDEAAKDGDGTVKVYPVSQKRALELTREVFKDMKADSIEDRDGSLVAFFSVNLISPGSYCGVYPVERDGKTEVRAVSRRRSSISIFTGLTEGGFHDAFGAKVGSEVAK